MKRILFFLFALPFALTGQETVTADTSYTENRNGVFWQVVKQTFATGRINTDETPLGSDTTEVANAIIGPAFQTFQQYAERAAFVQANFARQRQLLGAVNSSLMGLLGQNYTATLGASIGDDFLGNYTMRVNGGQPIQVEIIRLPAGVLRFRQGGTNFVFDILSRNWIRIRRYDGSATQTPDANVTIDLFLDPGSGTWIDATQGLGNSRYRLRKAQQ
jgi:hypothetical protein